MQTIIPVVIVAYLAQSLVLYLSNLSLCRQVYGEVRTWAQLVLAFLVPILLPCAMEARHDKIIPAFVAEAVLVVIITVEFSVLADFFVDRFFPGDAKKVRNSFLAVLVLASAGLDIVSLVLISSSDEALGPNTMLVFDASNCDEVTRYCKAASETKAQQLRTVEPELFKHLTGIEDQSLATRIFIYSLAGVAFFSSVSSILFATKERERLAG